MLQQTQVSRVLPKYAEFIEAFPSVNDLARASVGDVLRAWKGMGYNRRALYLQKSAQVVVKQYKGIFPQSEKELVQLPGLGIYTARAVLVFAFKQNVAAVDTNIRQIIIHHFFDNILQSAKVVQEAADELLPIGKSWEWHQALMDYGSIAMSSFRVKKPTSPSKKTPFKDTNRFFRGRIMDVLRDSSMKEIKLISKMSQDYKKSPKFIKSLVLDLEREGLVSRLKTGIISLPE
jgi:A/G-specific adenine glycosylase